MKKVLYLLLCSSIFVLKGMHQEQYYDINENLDKIEISTNSHNSQKIEYKNIKTKTDSQFHKKTKKSQISCEFCCSIVGSACIGCCECIDEIEKRDPYCLGLPRFFECIGLCFGLCLRR